MSDGDRAALQDVMLRYTAGVDERDMDLYRSCFVEDLKVYGMGPKPVYGREAWVEFVIKALERYGPTQHMLGPQLATISGDMAETRNDLQATHVLAADPSKAFVLWATYKTNMQRTPEGWKIARHELVTRATATLPLNT